MWNYNDGFYHYSSEARKGRNKRNCSRIDGLGGVTQVYLLEFSTIFILIGCRRGTRTIVTTATTTRDVNNPQNDTSSSHCPGSRTKTPWFPIYSCHPHEHAHTPTTNESTVVLYPSECRQLLFDSHFKT